MISKHSQIEATKPQTTTPTEAPTAVISESLRNAQALQSTIDDADAVTTRLPREKTDKRCRSFSELEVTFVTVMHQSGRSVGYISKMLGCSGAPIRRIIREQGL